MSSARRRAVITGCGVVTPIGLGLDKAWSGLLNGANGVGSITSFDIENYPVKFAAQVDDYVGADHFNPKELRRKDRFVQFGIVAAREAMADSGIDLEAVNRDRFGVIVGSGIGGIGTIEKQHKIIMTKGPRRASPFLIPMLIINMAAGEISIEFKLSGPCKSQVTACATGTHAIGDALRLIQYNEADIMLAGGTEAAITPLGFGGFCSIKALSSRNDDPLHASRPFDKERDGFVMGEGAGIVIVEELEHAKKRGAKIYGEICGYGLTSDAYHITTPEPCGRGCRRSITDALADAGVNTEDVDYVNAHGTSTYYNDKTETMALKKVFGEEKARKLKINSIKSMIGHLLGAAGAVEVISTVKTMTTGKIPPTINYEFPDPECDLDYVPNAAIDHPVKVAVSNSMGFGGQNATLVFRAIE